MSSLKTARQRAKETGREYLVVRPRQPWRHPRTKRLHKDLAISGGIEGRIYAQRYGMEILKSIPGTSHGAGASREPKKRKNKPSCADEPSGD